MTAGVLHRHVADNDRPTAPTVRLLDTLPDLRRCVPSDELAVAERALVVPAMHLAKGEAIAGVPADARRPFAWVVADGLLLRQASVTGRVASEVVGRSDVVPHAAPDDGTGDLASIELRAHRPTLLAVLDDRFRLAARRWPLMHDVVHAELARQISRTSRNMAILHLSRVDQRLLAVFRDLARRMGRVTVDGVVVDVELTHSLLGELVGARRPTVSLALTELAAAGALTRRDDRTWLLAADELDDA